MIDRLRKRWRAAVNWAASPPVVQVVGGLWLRWHGRGGSHRGPVDLRQLRSIAIVRYDGLGDLVVTTAFLHALRGSLPGVRLTLVVRAGWADLLHSCPDVDEVVGIDISIYRRFTPIRRVFAVARFCRDELWSRNVEAVLLVQADDSFYPASYFAYLSGAPIRMGRRGPGPEPGDSGRRQVNPCRQLLTHVEEDARTGHEVELMSAWLAKLGFPPAGQPLRLRLLWDGKADEEAQRCLGEAAPGSLTVALGIGASQGLKVWPVCRFIEIARRLRGINARVVLLGASDIQAPADQVVQALGEGVVNLVGSARLQTTAAALSRCDLFIGNDSGPMHVAAAVGIPVVEIVGWPSDTPPELSGSPLRIGPWCPHRRIVQPPGNGRDWTVRVNEIEVDAVWSAVGSILTEVRGRPVGP